MAMFGLVKIGASPLRRPSIRCRGKLWAAGSERGVGPTKGRTR